MSRKILFINDVGGEYAGSELSLYQFLEDLNRKDFEPVVLCYSDGRWAEKVRRLKIPIIIKNLGYYRRSRNPFVLVRQFFAFLRSVRDLSQTIRKEQIALVHVNKTSNAPIAILSAKKAGIPCVWHVRSFAMHLGLVAKYFVRSCSRLLFVSEAAKRPYEQVFPELREKFQILYNPVKLENGLVEKGVFKKELGLSSKTPLVGMVAHFTPWKKHDDFLMCAHEILKVMPDVRFVIVGGTLDSNPQEEKAKKDYQSKLHSIFEQYQLAGKVFFLGQRYDIKNIYSDLDILVIPSQFETFGRVAIEAALYRVPLVAYKGGGLPEIFLEGEEILFVAPGDLQSLSQKIIFLLNHSSEKMNQTKKAYEKALLFTSDRSIRTLEETYRELLNGVGS